MRFCGLRMFPLFTHSYISPSVSLRNLLIAFLSRRNDTFIILFTVSSVMFLIFECSLRLGGFIVLLDSFQTEELESHLPSSGPDLVEVLFSQVSYVSPPLDKINVSNNFDPAEFY